MAKRKREARSKRSRDGGVKESDESNEFLITCSVSEEAKLYGRNSNMFVVTVTIFEQPRLQSCASPIVSLPLVIMIILSVIIVKA